MKGRSIVTVIVPWLLVLALVGYELYGFLNRRLSDKGIAASLGREDGLVLKDARVLGKAGVFTVIAAHEIEGEEMLFLRANGIRLVTVWHDPNRLGHFGVSVYSHANGEPFVDCGAQDNRKFPSFLVLYPKSGPDAGKYFYGDYDLDGVFEVRKKSPW